MASQLVENLEEDLKSQIDDCCDKLHHHSNTLDDPDEIKYIYTHVHVAILVTVAYTIQLVLCIQVVIVF